MFETSLSIDANKKEFLEYLYDKVKPVVKDCGAAVVRREVDDRIFLSFACENRYGEKLRQSIYSALAEVYAIGFKYDYLKAKLNIKNENLLIKTLLNTMTVFDSNNDKKIVKKSLENEKIIAIDGFFDFRLKELKKKWDEIIDLTKENSIVLADEKVSGDFLMFLLDAIPHGEEGVKICKYGSDIEILDKAGKKISMINPVGEKKTQEEKVLFNLICLAPKKVLIYDEKSYSDEFLNIVKKFF